MENETASVAPDSVHSADLGTVAKMNATKMTFILGLFCLGILAYAAIAYVHLSFQPVSAALSIPYFVVRQRTALSALAMTVAVTCIIMGFAVFMIEAKGEINFRANSAFAKGSLVSGVPGPFFVLCGTIITVTVLFVRVSYEQAPNGQSLSNALPAASPGQQAGPLVKEADPAPSPANIESRTIASSPTQRIALYTTERTVYNDLMTVAVESDTQDDIKHLVANEESLSLVLIDWDDQSKRPASFNASDMHNRNSHLNVSQGYLFVLEGNNAGCVKAVLSAANEVASNFPASDSIPATTVSKIARTALKTHVVFTHGEPAV